MLSPPALALALAFVVAPEGADLDAPATRPVGDALTVDAEGSCLEHDRLVELIIDWRKRQGVEAAAAEVVDARLTIEVVDPTDEGVRSVIRNEGEFVSERPFDWRTDNCEDRHYTFALSLAMGIDATVLPAPPEPDPPEPDPPEPDPPNPDPPDPDHKPDPDPEPDPDPDPPPPRPPTTGVRVGAHGMFTIGTPTGLGGGGEIFLELGWLDLVDIDGRLFVATTGEQSFAGGTIAATAVAGRFDTCVGPQLGRVRPRACLGALSGAAIARGRDFRQEFRTRLPWVAFTLGGNVRVKLTPRVGLDFVLEGVGTALKPVFVVESDAAGDTERGFSSFGLLMGAGIAIQLR